MHVRTVDGFVGRPWSAHGWPTEPVHSAYTAVCAWHWDTTRYSTTRWLAGDAWAPRGGPPVSANSSQGVMARRAVTGLLASYTEPSWTRAPDSTDNPRATVPAGCGGLMGAGDYATGVGPMGFDPVSSSDPRSIYRAPAAQEFDGASRDFPLDATGNFEALHPVDQGVALSILVRRGAIKSAPAIGNTIHEIADVSRTRIAQQVETRINDAFPLRDFLSDGSVETLRIEHDVSVRGRLLVAYTYRNLLLGKRSGAKTVRTHDD